MDALEEYTTACRRKSDINELLPILKKYGDTVSHITEFGINTGESTRAWLVSEASTLLCYDIRDDIPSRAAELGNTKHNKERFVMYWDTDCLAIGIEATDLLFIDTKHSGTQLDQELTRHHRNVNKYIILHDTETFGKPDSYEMGDNGLQWAVEKFLQSNPSWHIAEVFHHNNGLTILQKQ